MIYIFVRSGDAFLIVAFFYRVEYHVRNKQKNGSEQSEFDCWTKMVCLIAANPPGLADGDSFFQDTPVNSDGF